MEEEEALAAPGFVGEMKEVGTVVESFQETVVTAVTTTVVDTITEGTEAETDQITEEEKEGEMEEEEAKAEMEGGDKNGKEEEEGQVKKSPGPWESEVRTFESQRKQLEIKQITAERREIMKQEDLDKVSSVM